jgi:DNA/RNA endonuclease YhcR with UshA esterase domain
MIRGVHTMRLPAVLLALMVAPAAFADDAPAKPLTPAEAAKKIDQQVTVEMEVKSTGGRSNRYLNSESDYKSPGNFTIFIAKEVLPKFKDAKIDDPADFYKGKTIRVSGTVTVYDGEPRIEIDKPDQITVVDKK